MITRISRPTPSPRGPGRKILAVIVVALALLTLAYLAANGGAR